MQYKHSMESWSVTVMTIVIDSNCFVVRATNQEITSLVPSMPKVFIIIQDVCVREQTLNCDLAAAGVAQMGNILL